MGHRPQVSDSYLGLDQRFVVDVSGPVAEGMGRGQSSKGAAVASNGEGPVAQGEGRGQSSTGAAMASSGGGPLAHDDYSKECVSQSSQAAIHWSGGEPQAAGSLSAPGKAGEAANRVARAKAAAASALHVS